MRCSTLPASGLWLYPANLPACCTPWPLTSFHTQACGQTAARQAWVTHASSSTTTVLSAPNTYKTNKQGAPRLCVQHATQHIHDASLPQVVPHVWAALRAVVQRGRCAVLPVRLGGTHQGHQGRDCASLGDSTLHAHMGLAMRLAMCPKDRAKFNGQIMMQKQLMRRQQCG